MVKNKVKVKENFCAACLAVPLILAGSTATGAGAMSKEEKEKKDKKKQCLMWGGVLLTIISIGVFVYFRYYSNCKSCRLN